MVHAQGGVLVKRKALVLGFLVLLTAPALGVLYVLNARYQEGPGTPAHRQGRAVAFLPPGLAALVCRASESQAACLQGYFGARIPKEIKGLPERYCRGLSGMPGRVCSEAVAVRLLDFPSSVRLCERLPDPGACARRVGLGAYVLGGRTRVEEECSKAEGSLRLNCHLGAAVEMVKRRPGENLKPAWELCTQADADGSLCARGLGSVLLGMVQDAGRARQLCLVLPSPQAARCAAGVEEAARERR